MRILVLNFTVAEPAIAVREIHAMREAVHIDSLKDEATRVVEEARMVLPGLQALLGFQLIAVFNQRFDQDLSASEQVIHLLAIVLVAIAGVLLMTPAAYQRQVEQGMVTRYFVDLASSLIFIAMIPLSIALSLDVFLLGRLILHSFFGAATVGGVVFAASVTMWFVFPTTARRRHGSQSS